MKKGIISLLAVASSALILNVTCANAKDIESTKSNMVISLNGTGRTVDSDKQVAVYDQPNGNVVRYLKPGTNWKIFKKYYDVDNNWYNLGSNQWVRE